MYNINFRLRGDKFSLSGLKSAMNKDLWCEKLAMLPGQARGEDADPRRRRAIGSRRMSWQARRRFGIRRRGSGGPRSKRKPGRQGPRRPMLSRDRPGCKTRSTLRSRLQRSPCLLSGRVAMERLPLEQSLHRLSAATAYAWGPEVWRVLSKCHDVHSNRFDILQNDDRHDLRRDQTESLVGIGPQVRGRIERRDPHAALGAAPRQVISGSESPAGHRVISE